MSAVMIEDETTVPGELHEIKQALRAGDARMGKIEANLAENTKTTNEIKDATADLIEFFNSAQGAFRVLEMLGKLARPLAAITALVAAGVGVWAAIKNGAPPDIGPKP